MPLSQQITKAESFFEIVHKEWEAIGQNKSIPDLDFKLKIHKKMLELFQVGDCYYFIFSPPLGDIEFVSKDLEQVLGYPSESFSIDEMMHCIHPDDLPFFTAFEETVVAFKMNLPPEQVMKYKTQYNYRIRKSDGQYLKILQQSITIQSDEDGAVLRNLIVHTDVSNFLDTNKMVLSFIGLEGYPSYPNYLSSNQLSLTGHLLTIRELEVVRLLAQHKNYKEVAEALHISPHTVQVHRKHIFLKTKTKSTLALIMKAKAEGWI